MQTRTILIIEDEVEIAELVSIHLRNEGFATLLAHDGKSGLTLFQQRSIDLVILDIMMPEMNGHEVLTQIRQINQTPVIFLSAKQSDFDKISGLVIGADDYMTKPFNPLELVARVNAQLRRAFQWTGQAALFKADVINIQNVSLDADQRTVLVNEQKVNLTPKEFEIFWLLASSPNQVFSSEKIFRRVWKEDYFEGANTVMVHIRTLRKKIEDTNKANRLIETVWGVGYKVNA